ncbi:MAG: ABC transporter ATP-binding protein [Pseudomonadota bacterium]
MTGSHSAAPSTAPPAIELRGIDKRFGAVHANRNVNLSVAPGSIHGIVGENGAGKSTLMSILYGFYQADAGDVFIGGEVASIRSSRDAIAAGIGMVHQHFMLVDTFTVLENVMLGAEQGAMLTESVQAAGDELARLSREYELTVDPNALVGELPVGEQQRTEILKALFRGARILVLDEPTGVLTPQEADQLFAILRALRDQGVTVILITHKLREIMDVTDAVSVMRAGEMVAHRDTAATTERELAALMVGEQVDLNIDVTPVSAGEVVLATRDLCARNAQGVTACDRVSFELRAGEILGVAGVSGNGQSELLEVLAGIRPVADGSFSVLGRDVSASSPIDPSELRNLRVNHVPEDRLRRGLVKSFDASENSILGYHDDPRWARGVLLDHGVAAARCARLMTEFDVRPPDPSLRAAVFSGGNQQKLVLAREIDSAPRLLLVGQPTRGVDIGAIALIHRRLTELRDAGLAILLVSVELDEILALADRIIVMCDGRIVGTTDRDNADKARLGLMMANADPESAHVH